MYSTPTSRRPPFEGSYISASGFDGIDLAVAVQSEVDVVHAHCPLIRTADAAKQRLVVGGRGSVDVGVLLRGVANDFHELGRSGVSWSACASFGIVCAAQLLRE